MYPLFNTKAIENTPFLFFTGKGGVGKTSTACATAVSLADEGKQVLIVSTDPASNLQDVFSMEVGSHIQQVESAPGLYAVNIDPEEAAATYREKVVGPYREKLPAPVVAQMEEQLSGACTVEIAAFDEFSHLLTDDEIKDRFDFIIFDTAPTGHTLRLLQLPTAWSGFLEESMHGASCLGPLSGLGEKKALYEAAVDALADRRKTTLILVTKLDKSAISEGERAAKELFEVGLTNQLVVINGVFQLTDNDDEVANKFYYRQQEANKEMSEELRRLPMYELPYIPFALTGIEALRKFFHYSYQDDQITMEEDVELAPLPRLHVLVERLSEKDHGVVMTMGKGGVGKTTVASAIAVGLAMKGKKVHLTTTDPAAHIEYVMRNNSISEQVTISRIDPVKEVESYRKSVLETAGADLDEAGLAYLQEDLHSPCTEEIAIFQAFSKVVDRAEDEFVIIDTAPTGHTLLLLDASQSYFQEIERSTGDVPDSVKKLLPRLRNREETDVVIVTLPEATPVLEASRLQNDLVRAGLTPSCWVINQSFAASHTKNPILRTRAKAEQTWIELVLENQEKEVVLIPWMEEEVVGLDTLKKLVEEEE
ncbi:arsenical pump-driving ATPase [Evansella sp. AB-rgal1]|uniref:arsenical pump-driving ATPase n=1 Tax=Evansella sp. AB-rgal1 TaxID=3242696 RepID=UPI00359EC35E